MSQPADLQIVAACLRIAHVQKLNFGIVEHSLSRFFEAALARHESEYPGPDASRQPFEPQNESPPHVHELIGAYTDSAELLGRRTAELHLALSSDTVNPQYAPVPFNDHYRQGLYHSLMVLAGQTLQQARHLVEAVAVFKLKDGQMPGDA